MTSSTAPGAADIGTVDELHAVRHEDHRPGRLRRRRVPRRAAGAARLLRAGREAHAAGATRCTAPRCATRWWRGCSARPAWKQYPQHADVADHPPGLRHRAAAHRHDGAAPAAVRGPGAPGLGDVADAGAAAAAAARDVGGQPAVRADAGRLRPASHREPGLHGRALHLRRHGGGVLAVAAPVDAVGRLREPRAPADLLGVAGRAGLDRAPTRGIGATCS